MFKDNKKYMYVFAGVFILVVTAQYLLPKPPSWRHTYLKKSKEPFGCYAVHELLLPAYGNEIRVNEQTLYNFQEKVSCQSSLLIINAKAEMQRTDVNALFTSLDSGAKVFMAANHFGGLLADTFHVDTGYEFFEFFRADDTLRDDPGGSIRLLATNCTQKTYVYSKVAWMSSFTRFDTTRFHILATSGEGRACLLRARIGKGELYLMSCPDVFSNYFIVNHENRELAYTLLSLIKNKTLVWDEYYKTDNTKKDSPLKFILQNDSLYAAYLLLLFTILAFMLMEGRRRQRALPVLEPLRNSTLEFVNVVSHVYFNSRNHHHIAAERIRYFYERIRNKFGVSTNEVNEQMIAQVSELSGVPHKTVRQLFAYCEKIKSSQEISEQELLELNRQISNFNKNSLR